MDHDTLTPDLAPVDRDVAPLAYVVRTPGLFRPMTPEDDAALNALTDDIIDKYRLPGDDYDDDFDFEASVTL